MNKETTKGIRTVQRSIDILQCFSMEERELTLTEIANKLRLAKSTTSRILATLESNDFVEKNLHNQKFKLGKKLYYLGLVAEKSIVLKEVAEPILKKLRDKTGETISLYILEKQHRECVLRYESLRSVQHIVQIGEKLPLIIGASGKAILAFQEQEFIEKVLDRVDSDVKKRAVKEQLRNIRKEKIAMSTDEREIGVSGIASPIFDANGDVKASISISGPRERFTTEMISIIKNQLKESSETISKNMGFLSKNE